MNKLSNIKRSTDQLDNFQLINDKNKIYRSKLHSI